MIILLNHRFCPESSFVCLLSNEKHKPAVHWGCFQNISSINQETAPSLFPSKKFLLRFTFHPLKLDQLNHFIKALLSSLIYWGNISETLLLLLLLYLIRSQHRIYFEATDELVLHISRHLSYYRADDGHIAISQFFSPLSLTGWLNLLSTLNMLQMMCFWSQVNLSHRHQQDHLWYEVTTKLEL